MGRARLSGFRRRHRIPKMRNGAGPQGKPAVPELVGRGAIQGARTSGTGNQSNGNPPGAPGHFQIPPPLSPGTLNPLQSLSHFLPLNQPPKWGRVCMWANLPCPPQRRAPNTPKALTLRGHCVCGGEGQKGLSLSEMPTWKDTPHTPVTHTPHHSMSNTDSTSDTHTVPHAGWAAAQPLAHHCLSHRHQSIQHSCPLRKRPQEEGPGALGSRGTRTGPPRILKGCPHPSPSPRAGPPGGSPPQRLSPCSPPSGTGLGAAWPGVGQSQDLSEASTPAAQRPPLPPVPG